MGRSSDGGATPLRAAIAAVRDCADKMETQAASLVRALPKVAIGEELEASALEVIAGLTEASSRVTFELALLQTELKGEKTDVATAVKRLLAMDAAMMSAVSALTDIVEQLEKAAERDERFEPAFLLMIEATGLMLQALDQAKAATQALGAEAPQD